MVWVQLAVLRWGFKRPSTGYVGSPGKSGTEILVPAGIAGVEKRICHLRLAAMPVRRCQFNCAELYPYMSIPDVPRCVGCIGIALSKEIGDKRYMLQIES